MTDRDRENLAPALGYLVLERDPDGSFRRLGDAPGWVSALFPGLENLNRPIQPADFHSPVLDVFLPECEEVWACRQPGPAASGVWSAQEAMGAEWFVEASSFRLKTGNFLLLHARRSEGDEERNLLQRVRDLELRHIRLDKEGQKKDILIHCIVHDLKAPAVSMQAFLHILLSEGPDPKRQEEILHHLERACEKQRRMISEILETFASEAGVMETFVPDPSRAPNAAECARAVTNLLRGYSGWRRVDVLLDAPTTACSVQAEAPQLDRVFLNLIENAVRFSPEGASVIVRIRDEGESVRIEIVDEGPGVPADRIPSLFQKFSRGRGSEGSMGLGLYYCRIMVERWGGALGYLPQAGGGSLFWVRLRLATAGGGR